MSNWDERTTPDLPTMDPGKPREIPPNTNGYIIRAGGVDLGKIEVGTGTDLHFHWFQTQTNWPSDFDLIDTTSTGTVVQSDKFTHTTFNATSVTFNKGDCQWRIEQKGKTIGYLHKTDDKLVWYATDLELSAVYFDEGDVSFKAHSETGTASARDATDFSL